MGGCLFGRAVPGNCVMDQLSSRERKKTRERELMKKAVMMYIK